MKQLPHLVELLDGQHSSSSGSSGGGLSNGALAQETPFGQLAPPLGSGRLKAVEVIYALLNQSNPVAEEGIMESGAIMKCLDLFMEFPFNNLLHHRVRPHTCCCCHASLGVHINFCAVSEATEMARFKAVVSLK